MWRNNYHNISVAGFLNYFDNFINVFQKVFV